MSFQLFCVCLRPSFPRNTTAYLTIPLPSHLFSHREPPRATCFYYDGGKLQKNERLPFPHLRDAATVEFPSFFQLLRERAIQRMS